MIKKFSFACSSLRSYLCLPPAKVMATCEGYDTTLKRLPVGTVDFSLDQVDDWDLYGILNKTMILDENLPDDYTCPCCKVGIGLLHHTGCKEEMCPVCFRKANLCGFKVKLLNTKTLLKKAG